MAVSDVVAAMRWLGHDGFLIKGNDRSIYIDPFKIESGDPADLILVTHEHFDHCSPEDIQKVQKEDTVIVTDAESAAKLSGNVMVVKPGDRVNPAGVDVEAVPAYNVNKRFHPRDKGWLGFVVTVDGVRVYHAGDTDLIPEMSDLHVDIALLPVSGTYVMTAQEAVEAVKRINPKVAIPMHYGAIVGSENDAATFTAAAEEFCKVVVLE
jgi:L-ascorbate metabolism protein UlaG (beta-lactamase superfamily)